MLNAELKQWVQVKLYIILQCGEKLYVKKKLHVVSQAICKSNYTSLPSCHFNDDASSCFLLNMLA